MIEIFQKSGDEISKIHSFQKNCWINITAPATSEIENICNQLKIPPNHISDPLDVDERARIDVEDNYMLILIRVP
ncbi:MAG: CorA family divalent cation transporter, partial [Victivallaceae bacterium]